jgi:general secretion pathway protein D
MDLNLSVKKALFCLLLLAFVLWAGPAGQRVHAGEKGAEETKESVKKMGQEIILNFDNADLYEVINTIADILGINYIIDPRVKGNVTIYTARGLSKKDLFSVFFQILEVNGITAVKEGGIYRIFQLTEGPRMPIDYRSGLEVKDIPPPERIVIQIIPLKFISAQEVTKLLTPFVSAGGTIVVDASSNTLLVVDKWANIMKILRLVETFDVNIFEKVHYRIYRLKYLDVEEAPDIISGFSFSFEKAGNVVVKVIPIGRLNALLVISTTPVVFGKLEEVIQKIDVEVEGAEPKVYVYYVKNGEAKDLGALLNQVFPEGGVAKEKKAKVKAEKKAGGEARISRNPLSQERVREKEIEKEAKKEEKAEKRSEEAKAAVPGEAKGAGTLREEVRVTADEIRNALIIQATPRDYKIILDILRQLDVLPRQVLIEATIAEITRDSESDIGISWAFGSGAAAGDASFRASLTDKGFSYAVGVTDKWYVALSALATKGKVNVLSSPHILASENKEAKIDVSREIPLASSEWTFTSGTEPVTQTNVQYRDTGVILSVTPHINEQGLVTMDISEEVSDLEKAPVKVAGVEYPSFFKRTVNTTLTVKHGQTIAIGGLIKDKEDEGISGLPCLIDIPGLRYLFGQTTKAVSKIELIVLITPRVIVSLDDVEAVTDEFKKKVKSVMKRFSFE